MGAWSDLTINYDVVAEIDAAKLADQAAVNAVNLAAKGLVADALVARLGPYVPRYGSPEALLDAVAALPGLASGLQRALAYAALHVRLISGRNTASDVWSDTADDYLRKMKAAVAALTSVAPNLLGLTRSAGRSPGGSLASVYT